MQLVLDILGIALGTAGLVIALIQLRKIHSATLAGIEATIATQLRVDALIASTTLDSICGRSYNLVEAVRDGKHHRAAELATELMAAVSRFYETHRESGVLSAQAHAELADKIARLHQQLEVSAQTGRATTSASAQRTLLAGSIYEALSRLSGKSNLVARKANVDPK